MKRAHSEDVLITQFRNDAEKQRLGSFSDTFLTCFNPRVTANFTVWYDLNLKKRFYTFLELK